MDPILALSLQSMHQDMNRLDRIAMNLVNVSTPGYRREVMAVRPFGEVLGDLGMKDEGQPGRPVTEVRLDPKPGTLRVTNHPLDLALTGSGFFVVQTDQGPAYTRQGHFRLDPQGRLISSQGHPVMGKSGGMLVRTPTPAVDSQGRITDPKAAPGTSALLGELRVVRFEKPELLQRVGDGLFVPLEGMTPLEEPHPQIQQGALENSNVGQIQEMVSLMETMRHFESMQKVVQGYNDMLGAAIQKLGEMS